MKLAVKLLSLVAAAQPRAFHRRDRDRRRRRQATYGPSQVGPSMGG